MALPNSSSPLPGSSKTLRSIGHTWLTPLYVFVDYLVSRLTVDVSAAWGPVRLMTATALAANTYSAVTKTKTANSNGALGTIDGIAPAVGDRIWDKDAATGSERGLFIVTSLGGASANWTMVRAPDAFVSADFVNGRTVSVGSEGTANANTAWSLTNATFTLDTTTPALGTADAAGALTVAGVQTNNGIKSFTTLTLAVWNAGNTFVTSFASAATAARTFTLPDWSGTPAQQGVATGGTAPGFTGSPVTPVPGSPVTGLTGTSTGQVVSLTVGSVTLNQYKGGYLFDGYSVFKVLSNTATSAGVATFTVFGAAPAATITGVGQIVTEAVTAAGTVASHTHAQS